MSQAFYIQDMCMWHAWSLHDSDIINEYAKLLFNMKSIEVEEDI